MRTSCRSSILFIYLSSIAMATPLIVNVVAANEQIDNFLMFNIHRRLTWNIENKHWYLENDQRKLKAFRFLLYVVLTLTIIPLYLFLIINQALSLNLLSKTVTVAWGFFGFFASFIFLFDTLIYWFGNSLVLIVNSLLTRVDQTSGRVPITPILRKNLKHKQPDLYGIVLASFYITILFISFSVPIFSAASNLDPISVYYKLVFGSPKSLFGKTVLFFVKLVILLPIAYFGTSVVRSFFPLLLFLGMLIIKMELLIYRLPTFRLGIQPVKLYKELCICFKILTPFLSSFLISFLTSNLFGLILTINGTLIGWKFLPLNFYIISPMTMITLLVYLELLFRGSCMFYVISTKILQVWSLNRTMMSSNNFARIQHQSILAALQPIRLPVGHFVNIDLSFKVTYLNFVQCRVVESIIAFQEWVNSKYGYYA